MSWLVVEKVLPPLQVGEPPNYRAILADQANRSAVCWSIRWNDKLIGFAASMVVTRNNNMREIHSRVYFSQLPLDEMAPGWLGAIVRPVLSQVGKLDMDAQSRLEIDPLDHLTSFESRVRLASIPNAIRMNGTVDGNRLKLAVQSGDFSYRTEKYLPPDALVGDELSPQACLPGLVKGQQWTMPVYSPFRPPNSPIEILQAKVEREETLNWNGESVNAKLVVYRNDSGASLVAPQEARGRLWARSDDGTVLKQEVQVFNSRLQFERLSPCDGRRLVRYLHRELGEEWTGELTAPSAHEIWSRLSVGSESLGTDAVASPRYRRRTPWSP
jgi:hypothetical protein